MITLGRRGDIHARRQALAFLRTQEVVHQLFSEVAPRFKERPGGYTRIVKLGPRQGDAAEMADNQGALTAAKGQEDPVGSTLRDSGRAQQAPQAAAARPSLSQIFGQ